MPCPYTQKNCRQFDLEAFGTSLDQIKNQLENDKVKVSGSLEDRYQIYLENTSENPLSFDEWLNR